jgi:hypothetical protein
MNARPIPSTSVPESSRCQYRTQNGQCRMLAVDFSSTLCLYHARQALPEVPDTVDLLRSLTQPPAHFNNAQEITNALGALFSLLAQGRISPRRATSLAYIANLLLHNLPAAVSAPSPHAEAESQCSGQSLDWPTATNRNSADTSPKPVSPRVNSSALNANHSVAPIPKPQPVPETVEGFLAAVRNRVDTSRDQRDTS